MNTILLVITYLVIFACGYQVGRIYTARSVMYTMTKVGRKTFPNYDLEMTKALLGELNEARAEKGKAPLSIKDVK